MKRRIVAAFIADIYQDMVKETEHGTICAAKEQNIKLLFFTSFSDNFSNTEYTRFSNYDIGDVAIYKLPDLSKFDGLFTYDSYMPDLFLPTISEIKKDCPCPIVTLGDVSEYSYNVVNDHNRSFMELIEHLINVHECRELIHVTGNLELSFCMDRLNVFKKTLEKNGIPYDDSNIVNGNLWYDCAERVVDTIIEKYESHEDRSLPDAIVCANDYMAIGVSDELKKRGFIIPEDIIVTGYDDVIQSRFHDPSITTSAQPFELVGRKGIKILSEIWNDQKPPHITAVPGVLQCRQSCGCMPKHTYQEDELRESYAEVILKLGRLSQSSTNLILSVSSAESNDDVFNEIEKNCCLETGFQNAVLCLMDGWDQQRVINNSKDFADCRFNVVCGIYNGSPVKRESLPKGSLLPKNMMDDPEAYYLVPIHHMQYFIGYFIISPNLKNLSQANIKSWFINVSTMLENWRVKQELKITVNKLEALYATDTLTGLYNRRGYGMHFPEYYNHCKEDRTDLAVFVIDMDNLKRTNDNYGHDEGDYALTVIGSAMKDAAANGEICVRSGGDEFVILAMDYDEEKKNQLIKKIRDNISAYCQKDSKPYDITVSIGCYMATPKHGEISDINDLSEMYLREADRLMYIEKKSRKPIQ